MDYQTERMSQARQLIESSLRKDGASDLVMADYSHHLTSCSVGCEKSLLDATRLFLHGIGTDYPRTDAFVSYIMKRVKNV